MSSTTTTTQQTSQISVAPDSPVPRGPVSSQITFFQDPEDGSTPFNYVNKPLEGQAQRNFGSNTQNVSIQDIRDHESDFSLDTSGFAAVPNVPSELTYDDWENDETVKAKYYPEIESFLLKNTPGANRIFIFDHTIRRTRHDSNREPVMRAHIDQTNKSAIARVRHHLPDEADKLAQDRVRIINVWRPLKGPVKAFPLAMADSRSVGSNDLIGVEHRYPDRTGETAGVRHNGQQSWWYWSGMNENERILLQCFDNRGTQARVAHTAFVDPRSAPSEGRESIEVRALVFG